MILYNASSSYYSMIARLALLEAEIPFKNKRLDIHIAKEQFSAWYRALNPNMTVPTLADGKNILTDSRDILHLAAKLAGNKWLDENINAQPAITAIEQAFYAIPIEDLTFAKAMTKMPPLHFILPKVLGKVVKDLKAELATCPDPSAVQAKIKVNEGRIAYFTEGDLNKKLDIERHRVSSFLGNLPLPQYTLFGDKISSADIVTTVLLGRLEMTGEYDLVKPFPELDQWFKRMQLRSAYKDADIWTTFQFWRIPLKR